MEVMVHVFAILEGGLSGLLFCHARQTKNKTWKILLYIMSVQWFFLALLDSMVGCKAWRFLKEIIAARRAKIVVLDEEDEGDEEDE